MLSSRLFDRSGATSSVKSAITDCHRFHNRESENSLPLQQLSVPIQKIFASLSSASSRGRFMLINFHSIASPVGKCCRCQWTIISKAAWQNAVENVVNQAKLLGIGDSLGISISMLRRSDDRIDRRRSHEITSAYPFGEPWPWTLVGVIYEARGTRHHSTRFHLKSRGILPGAER